jgi:hypothetical protein
VLDYLWPLLGMTETTPLTTYSLGATDVLGAWNMDINFGGSIHGLANCVCEKWAIRGGKGSSPIQMQIDYIAETEAEEAFAGTALDIEDVFAYTDMTVFTYDGTDRLSADRILIQVDNKPVIEYGASVTMTDAHLGAREVVIATSLPYSSTHDDMYWTNRDDETGLNTVMTFVSADRTYTFTAATAIGITALGPVLARGDQIRTPVTLIPHRSYSAGRVSPLTLAMSNT